MLLYFSILTSTTIVALYAQAIRNHTIIRRGEPKYILFLCFFVLFLFSAARYKVGADYPNYERIFGEIRKGYRVHTEIGFNLIVKLISQFTDNNQAAFAVFSFLTIAPLYKVIQKRSKDWGFSVFLFVGLGYYFFSFQSIRQYLAYMMAIYALDKMIDKKYGLFILWSVIGITFHKSCAVILPAYLMTQLKLNRIFKIFFLTSGLLVIKYRELLRKIIFYFYPSYEGTNFDRINVSYKNLLICACFCAIFVLCCYNKKKGRELIILENLCLFSMYFYLFCWWIPEISRIGFYLLIPVCILLPNVLAVFRNTRQRVLIKICICAGSILLFYSIMSNAHNPAMKLLPYQTWIGL